MSSDLETRISLELFHRHFILTHMKKDAASVLDDLERRANQSSELLGGLLGEWMKSHYPQSGFQDDEWYAREVPLASCYFAHTDFRGHLVPKDQRFVDFLCDQRQKIESGSFPCSSEICAPWAGQMPEPLVQERGTGKYYILDGQLRVIRHWYHNILDVKVLIYRGELAV